MKQNEKLIMALTDEELMELTGGFIESAVAKGAMVTLLYAIRPNPKPIIDFIFKVLKK
ncbi:hypothetical protein [Cellulosilyticum lentocellum]|uniref:Uncharacterized protein n=1 Tax=Cellulosilyticum lentocellum (strain ATCC 49066 / DSM 5427 / NCIMB 11756 / RHM5) TaxID=642492 RepID=F2JGF5_CELLD|nr:hypothetical protein [Cellulosilyticum lentocellum]ADZ81850.1 hypothetical protein Clole_0090 [Cellulosilyticum lentocellum DSM 5427]